MPISCRGEIISQEAVYDHFGNHKCDPSLPQPLNQFQFLIVKFANETFYCFHESIPDYKNIFLKYPHHFLSKKGSRCFLNISPE